MIINNIKNNWLKIDNSTKNIQHRDYGEHNWNHYNGRSVSDSYRIGSHVQ